MKIKYGKYYALTRAITVKSGETIPKGAIIQIEQKESFRHFTGGYHARVIGLEKFVITGIREESYFREITKEEWDRALGEDFLIPREFHPVMYDELNLKIYNKDTFNERSEDPPEDLYVQCPFTRLTDI